MPHDMPTIEPTDDNFEKQINKIEELFVKHSTNVDGFWNIECDSAYNFKYYFNNFNSINLSGTRIAHGKRIMRDRDTIFHPN